MLPVPRLGQKAVADIKAHVAKLFGQLRMRVLGNKYPAGKFLVVASRPDLSLRGLFEAAQTAEGVKPREEVVQPLLDVANSYLDAAEARAQAGIVHEVQAFLHDAARSGVKTDASTVLGGKLADIFGKAAKDVRRILEAESTLSRNTGAVDGISRVAAAIGIEDPVMVQLHPLDEYTCEECLRICYMPDRLTPRAWRMSELKAGYHVKGEDIPSLGGQHPHCRGHWTQILPGYGFNAAGRITHVEPGYDLISAQRDGSEEP